MPKFGHLGSKFLKTNVRLDISNLEIKIMQNFVKIFKSKMLKFGYTDSKFLNTNEKLKTHTFKIWYMQNFVKIRKSILLDPKCPNLGIWTPNLKIES